MDERKCFGAKAAAALINLDEELLSNNDDTVNLYGKVHVTGTRMLSQYTDK